MIYIFYIVSENLVVQNSRKFDFKVNIFINYLHLLFKSLLLFFLFKNIIINYYYEKHKLLIDNNVIVNYY